MLGSEMFDNVIVAIDDYDAGRDAVGLATRLVRQAAAHVRLR
jgi:hypothetical protein